MKNTKLKKVLHVRVNDGGGPTIEVRLYSQSDMTTHCVGTARVSHRWWSEVLCPLLTVGSRVTGIRVEIDTRRRIDDLSVPAGPVGVPDVPNLGG